MSQFCNKCGETKPDSEYCKSSRYCRECRRVHVQRWRAGIRVKDEAWYAFRRSGLMSARELYSKYKRGKPWELTMEQFLVMTKRNCHYCGLEPKQVFKIKKNWAPYQYNGIDRMDNDLGYTTDNAVPCCKYCNLMKMGTPYAEFLRRVGVIDAMHGTNASAIGYIKAHSPCRGCENKDHCEKMRLIKRKACGQYEEWNQFLRRETKMVNHQPQHTGISAPERLAVVASATRGEPKELP